MTLRVVICNKNIQVMFGNLYNVSVWGKIDLNTMTKA